MPFPSVSKIISRLATLFYVAVILLVLAIGGVVAFAVNYMASPGPLTEENSVVIIHGTALNNIAKQLEEAGIISHSRVFSLLARFFGAGDSLQAGEYLFPPAISPSEVFRKISSGDVVIRQVTIAEGLMTSQILEIIANAEGLTGEVPDDVAEGELLPETYHYSYGESRERMVRRMQNAMNRLLEKLWEERKEGLPLKNKREALILASIVEKETGVKAERQRVAAVFINRLNKGMRLQTDPTVIYAITGGEYVMERPLLLRDLEIDSRYNSYKYHGLPPGPIANPGRASLKAALNPDDTDELFFVADGTGGHSFGRTLEEHNSNVRKWRQINRERRQLLRQQQITDN